MSYSSELGTRCMLFAQLVGMPLICSEPRYGAWLWSMADKEQRVDTYSPGTKAKKVYYINSIIPDPARG